MLNSDILLISHHFQVYIIKHSPEIGRTSSTQDPLHMDFRDPSRHPNDRTALLAIYYPRVLRRWHLENNFKNSLSYQIIQVSLQEGKELWRRWFPFYFRLICSYLSSKMSDEESALFINDTTAENKGWDYKRKEKASERWRRR